MDGRLLFAGRESYFRQPSDIPALVRPRMTRVFPALESIRIEYAWSGTVGITYTRLPHVGKNDERLLFAHGYSGHGVALATMVGRLLAEEAQGGSERFRTLAALPAKPFPGPRWARKGLMAAGLYWYKLQDAL
jgi:gamma-glutamylputrescine oxidase